MFNLRGIHKIFQNNIFVSRTFSTNSLATFFVQMSSIRSLCKLANILLFMLLIGGGGDCRYQEPWLPFWENVAKLLEGRTRINKLNVPLKVKV